MSDESPSIYGWLASQVELYVQPLRTAVEEGPEALTAFVTKATGIDSETITEALEAFAETTTSVAVSSPEAISSPSELKEALQDLLGAWKSLTDSIPPSAIAGLFEYLSMQWVWSIAPATYSALGLLDVIDDQRAAGDRVRLDNLEYLWKPADLMRDVYQWESDFAAELFIRRLTSLGKALGAPIGFAAPSSAATTDLVLVDSSSGGQPTNVLVVPLLRRMNADVWYAAGINLIGTPGDSSNAALTLVPFGLAGFPSGSLVPGWSVNFKAGGVEGLGIAFRPPREIVPVKVGSPTGDPSFELTIERDPTNPLRLALGSDFHVTAKQTQLYLATDLDDDFTIRFRVVGLEIKIGGSGGDGFLSKVLPKDGLTAKSDFVITWSADGGLRFEGGLGFLVSIPLHLTLGPIKLSKLSIGATLSPSPLLILEGRVDVGAELGPIQTTIAGIGLACTCDLARDASSDEDGARFGPVMLDIGFLAPTGAGLSIAAGPVTGGGFIRHEGSTYSGILNLKFSEIGLVAIAIITTEFPDGHKGFALFINIGVTFSPAISLPYLFALVGCGGLAAVNRTMDTEALRSGLRNKTLDSILFPEDPILNANKIISDSERVFPIEEGRYVFGPMAKLTWGAKSLVTANIAIIIELPAPIVIALLGQVKVRVPQSDEPKVKLNLDILGVLEIEKKSLSFDATLYDSKILVYDLYGDSALRLRWGSSPQFAMSVGGFHPKFTPPPDFPSLRRLTLSLSSGSSFELSCKVYHALTSNTLQFGAKLTIHAEACGADVDGYLSFDTLFQFSPFEFQVNLSGGVGISYRGHDLASVHLSCDLSGPTPWHAKGKAKFSILWWDVCAHFDKTWGNDNKASTAKIDPLPEFLAQLNVIANWGGALSPRRTIVESLKSLNTPASPPPATSSADTTAEPDDPNKPHFLAHPAGNVEFRQQLLPLDLKLELFKNVDVKTHDQFDVNLELGPEAPPTAAPTDADNPCQPPPRAQTETELKEHFARAQFKSLSKADKLSKPSFERFRAGIQIGPSRVRLEGCVQECELEFESILIMPDGVRERCTTNCTVPWALMKRTLRLAALRNAGLRRQRMGKFGVGGPPRVAVVDEAYAVVDKVTLTRAEQIQPRDSAPINQTQAEDLIRAAIAEHLVAPGSVIVVPEIEEVT